MSENDPTQKIIDTFSTHVEKELISQFGDKGGPMHKLFQRQFKIHYNNYSHMMTDDLAKQQGINSIFVMALDDVMCEVRASFTQLKDTVLSIYREMLRNYYETETNKLISDDDAWAAFTRWAKKGNMLGFDNDFFQVSEVDKEEGCYGFDIGRCLYFDILREAGKPELGPILCEFDSIHTEFVSNWVRFTRRETIATGDKRCDFRYCRV